MTGIRILLKHVFIFVETGGSSSYMFVADIQKPDLAHERVWMRGDASGMHVLRICETDDLQPATWNPSYTTDPAESSRDDSPCKR